MTPATAIASFETMGGDTILKPSFSEMLWYLDETGRLWIKIEWSTRQFQNFNRPGRFVRGGAQGAFTIAYGPELPRTARQFWWPPNATSQQPPAKAGQNMWGEVWYSVGVDPSTVPLGYTRIIPKPGVGNVRFELNGVGMEGITLGAEHFIERGDVKFYTDFSYMIGQ
jgi:hypothetical protein